MKHFKNKAKRIFAAMLCLCMLASVLPMGASAANAEGSVSLAFEELGLAIASGVSDAGVYNKTAAADQLLATSEGSWVAYAIGNGAIPAGDYNAVLKYTTSGLGCVVDFYVVKASNDVAAIDAALASIDPVISELDFVTSSAVQQNEKSFSVNIPEDGEYMFVAKVNKKTGGLYFWLEGLEMKWTPPISETFNFKLGDGKWHTFDGTLKDYNASLNSNWKYYAHAASAWTDENGNPLTLDKMMGTPNGLATDKAVYHPTYGFEIYSETTDRWMAMALDIKTPGVYLLDTTAYCYSLGAKVDFYLFPEKDVNVAADATALQKQAAVEQNIISANYAGQMNQKISTAGNYSQTLPNQIVVPKAGEYVLVMKCAEKYWIHLENLALRRVGDAPAVEEPVEITNAEIFGDVSAYITKDGTFTAFAGIDSTNYKEVGFIINGDYVPVENNAVYESIKVTSTKEETITSADFFKSTSPTKPYVFFSSKTVTGTVVFQPYAVPVDGDYDDAIVGHEYSVTLS